jgi:hypothetical protein
VAETRVGRDEFISSIEDFLFAIRWRESRSSIRGCLSGSPATSGDAQATCNGGPALIYADTLGSSWTTVLYFSSTCGPSAHSADSDAGDYTVTYTRP